MIRFETMLTRTAAAAILGLGFATAAVAEEWTGPRVVGSGENASVEYAAPSTNIVGGALTQTVGSGESARTQVLTVQNRQVARPARVVGSGDNLSVVHSPAPRG